MEQPVPVVESESLTRLIFAEKAGWLEFWVGEAQVLMQVVEPVEEVAQVAPQHAQDPVVPVLTCDNKLLVQVDHKPEPAVKVVWRKHGVYQKQTERAS